MTAELDRVKRHRDSLAHEASASRSQHDTVRTSASAYSKAVVSSAIELQRHLQTIESLKEELDDKDRALVRPRCRVRGTRKYCCCTTSAVWIRGPDLCDISQ